MQHMLLLLLMKVPATRLLHTPNCLGREGGQRMQAGGASTGRVVERRSAAGIHSKRDILPGVAHHGAFQTRAGIKGRGGIRVQL